MKRIWRCFMEPRVRNINDLMGRTKQEQNHKALINQQEITPWGNEQGYRDSRQQVHGAGPAAKRHYCNFTVALNTGIWTIAVRALWMQQRKEEGFPGMAAEVIRTKVHCSSSPPGRGAPDLQRGNQVPVLISGKTCTHLLQSSKKKKWI